jgi:hypothetical protein
MEHGGVGYHLPLEVLVHEPIADPNLHRQQRERLIGRLQGESRLIRGCGLGRPSV